MCAACGAVITTPTTCGDRTCPTCRQESGRRLRRRYLPLLQQCKTDELALITLTLLITAGPEDLYEKLERIRAAWSKLIRLAVWRPVRGGLAAIEVLPARAGAWNVHIHAIAEAGLVVRPFSYYDKAGRKREGADILGAGQTMRPQDVSAAWHRLTGDSYIVDIRRVKELPNGRGGARGALAYVLKYLVKPQEWAGFEARAAYNRVMHGRRLILTFGQWHPTHKRCRWRVIRKVPARPCRECGQVAGWLSVFGLWALSDRAQPYRGPPVPLVVDNHETKTDSRLDGGFWPVPQTGWLYRRPAADQ